MLFVGVAARTDVDNHKDVVNAVSEKNYSEIAMPHAMIARPLSRHGFYAGHLIRVASELRQFGFQLCLDARVHSFDVPSSA